MAVVATASLAAAGLIATGLSGCADLPDITPKSSMRDAQSLGLQAPATEANVPVTINAEWWRDFGDEPLNRLIGQAL